MRLKLNFSLKNKSAFSLIELSIVILVIGVLIAGVVTGSKMVTKAKIAMAVNQTKSSPVHSIKDIIFWVETSSTGSIIGSNSADSNPIDGNAILKWNDINPQSLTKINPVPLNSAGSPIYKENGINGLPSLLFDGVDDMLNVGGITVSKNNAFFAVFRLTTPLVGSRYTIMTINSYGQHGILFDVHTDNTIRSLYRSVMGATGGTDLYSSLTVSSNKNYILSSVKDYNTSSQKVWINNSLCINSTSSNLGELNNPYQSVTIGNLSASDNRRAFYGQISEIIIYNRALKQDEIDDVEAYLGKKYSISLN